MKLFLLLALLGLAGGFYYYQNYRQPVPEPPAAQRTVASKPGYIECPYCSGLGKLIDQSGVNQVGYRCPICHGNGKTQDKGAQACTICKGFGKVPMKQAGSSQRNSDISSGTGQAKNNRMIAQRCPVCRGSGLTSKTLP